jgi:hypothetical protein
MRKFCLRAVRGRSVVPKAGLAIVLCLALAVVALAAPGGIDVGFASGHSDTLQADGTSRTVLEVTLTSLSDACWGGEVSGPGTFSLLVSATKATVEPTVAVDVQFPAHLTVTAGKESGTVEVKVQASWCPEDAVGAFGVCSDQSRARSATQPLRPNHPSRLTVTTTACLTPTMLVPTRKASHPMAALISRPCWDARLRARWQGKS